MMRKNLFHPSQLNQQHSFASTKGNSNLGDIYAMQPEHIVHSVLYRLDAQEQVSSNDDLSVMNIRSKK